MGIRRNDDAPSDDSEAPADRKPDPELLAALDVEDPVPGLLTITRGRLLGGEPSDGVLLALRSVWDEDPAPVEEVIDRLRDDR
jgi:hypothetical protein